MEVTLNGSSELSISCKHEDHYTITVTHVPIRKSNILSILVSPEMTIVNLSWNMYYGILENATVCTIIMLSRIVNRRSEAFQTHNNRHNNRLLYHSLWHYGRILSYFTEDRHVQPSDDHIKVLTFFIHKSKFICIKIYGISRLIRKSNTSNIVLYLKHATIRCNKNACNDLCVTCYIIFV